MLLGLVRLLVPSAAVMRRSVPSRRLCLQELLPSLTFLHLVEKLARNLLVAARQILISSPPLDDASFFGPSSLIVGLLRTAVLVVVLVARVLALGQDVSNGVRLAQEVVYLLDVVIEEVLNVLLLFFLVNELQRFLRADCRPKLPTLCNGSAI